MNAHRSQTFARQAWRRLKTAAMLLPFVIVLAVLNRDLRQARQAAMPPIPPDMPEAPPWVDLLTVSLGGFRGVISSLLWMRASLLQEQGRYVELIQLSDWITQLDPHAVDAWSYHAWNLAYNVSVMFDRPSDRLRWVDAGINLLRDRALRLNPSGARLYRELGWMYQHKIGAASDAAHMHYKQALGKGLTPWLENDGSPPPAGTAEANALSRKFRLDIDFMRVLNRRFGPLDWRLPESHAIYWATQGLALTDSREDLLLRRMIYQSLVVSVKSGRLTDFAPGENRFERDANLEMIPGTVAFFEETLGRYRDQTLERPFALFLAIAIPMLHNAGDEPTARALYDRLTTLPSPEPAPDYETLLNSYSPEQH